MKWQWTSIDSISQINEHDYAQLVPLHALHDDAKSSPFIQYAFLESLEKTACVGEKTGWMPKHIVIINKQNNEGDITVSDAIKAEKIVAFIPAYIKTHSYGEYVFDHSWAHAYQQHGLNYYPKLVMALPFTPVSGTRVLKSSDADDQAIIDYLASIKNEILDRNGVSSIHILFPTPGLSNKLQNKGFHQRQSVQFNWFNKNYTNYEQFNASLTARRRRSIKKERAAVTKQGVSVKRLVGAKIQSADMQFFYICYQQTYLKRSGHTGYLTQAFFHQLLASMANNLMLIIAEKNNSPVAAALFFHDKNGLYGRYWGALEDISGLHFEVCYYQGIEHCITHNIPLFNPGTQGEHKILRGFEPTLCYSNHCMAEQAFDHAVQDFLHRENPHIVEYYTESHKLLPYKQLSD